ncbi:ABC transporter ATP-binding protein [Nocardioides panaciterrulae]|uniref:ABC-2 type transport system ATP-binding protein n=1 Tax=Nocardioides panaciterrulae TaxID=661492 RepID=A0A7Y9E9G9_9ACTN|nr:ABC transporter ATP-binding protein [Nocardioides panaciterrulae]NYD43676.1 ABC-2 type transport system ATP-binding protein [Nocardioides panaciterrulae]
MDAAIRTRGLRKEFRGTVALHGLDLVVPRGSVFGYLGPNGAGKTTTIRLLTGLLRPTAGRAEVLGLDVTRAPDAAQRRIGYLPGRFVAYADLSSADYLRFLAALRGGVAWREVERLADRFDLDLGQRIGTLSHGNRQKVGLVQAFMHRPDLLVLDEPTTGLDPLMQQEFLTLVTEEAKAGTTLFLSSHILSEVEAVADTVGILRAGELVRTATIPELRERVVRRWDLTFTGAPPAEVLASCPGVRDLRLHGNTAHLALVGSAGELLRAIAPYGVENLETHEPDLASVFLRYYTDRQDGPDQGRDQDRDQARDQARDQESRQEPDREDQPWPA